MRKFFICIVVILISQGIFAQQKQGYVMRPSSKGMGNPIEIGRAQMKVMYALNAIDIQDERTYIDLHVLLASKNIVKHYSRFLELNDSLFDDFNKRNPKVGSRPRVFYAVGRNSDYWSEYQFTDIYTENNRHNFYVWMPRYMERYNAYYTESVEKMDWKLHNEKMKICGYECQRATCHWRGRDFEAWFSTEIPVRLGPWTFGGLPGLILKLYDSEKLYVWEAVSLQSGNFPIMKRSYEGFRRENREKVYKLQLAVNRDYLKVSGARNRKTGQLKSNPRPYEPLEKLMTSIR